MLAVTPLFWHIADRALRRTGRRLLEVGVGQFRRRDRVDDDPCTSVANGGKQPQGGTVLARVAILEGGA